MPVAASARQTMADAFKGLTTGSTVYVSVHTADPGASGTTGEASGGSPAYARKPSTITSGSGGVLTMTAVTADLQAGTYTHAGYFTAATGGTFLGAQPLAPNITLSAQGTITITPGLVAS